VQVEVGYRMLDAFASVGARSFDVTFLDIDGTKRGFRAQQSLAQLRNSLPKLLPGLAERGNSLVVRPHAEDITLIQLDDLDIAALERVSGIAFLTLETSPGNYQAWAAVRHTSLSSTKGDSRKELARRLRKGTGADLSASGASRLAGIPNYKRKYDPDFPLVQIESIVPGRITTEEQLEESGLLAAAPKIRVVFEPLRVSSSRSWPDYEPCVAKAPLNRDQTSPDISRAGFFWALLAAQRKWKTEEIAARLMEVSTKARENGEAYAGLTAQNASVAVTDRKRGRA
jgi:hypothetical protein